MIAGALREARVLALAVLVGLAAIVFALARIEIDE